MHELISHLGLRFYLFGLGGSLKYTLTRRGHAPKIYEICEADIEDGRSSDTSSTEEPKKMKAGIEASAVGIQLRLIKNDGVLKIDFEGKNSSTAQWTFQGMQLSDGERLVATATTQTHIDPKKCLMCGEKQDQMTRIKHEGTQIPTVTTQTAGFQVITRAPRFARSILEGRIRRLRKELDENIAALNDFNSRREESRINSADTHTNQMKCMPSPYHKTTLLASASTGTQTDSGQSVDASSAQFSYPKDTTATNLNLKRKASTSLEGTKPLHKRAKSKHASEAWPRHIYMECSRTTPTFMGDVGVLHIDIQEAAVWYEGWYGMEDMRVHERKQVYLGDKTTRVTYKPNDNNRRGDKATHRIIIEGLNAAGGFFVFFVVDCLAPSWQIWGLDTPYFSFSKPSIKARTPITDPMVIIDALVHCIDITSRRSAVHDPDRDHKLAQQHSQMKALETAGPLSFRESVELSQAVKDMEKRDQKRKKFILLEEPKENDSESITRSPDIPGTGEEVVIS